MECIHCKAWNEQDERRCLRCGRRLHPANPRPAPEFYAGSSYPVSGFGAATAAAPALEPLPGGRPLSQPVPPEPSPQTSLFRDAASQHGVSGNAGFGNPKVIPIPMLTPARPPSGQRKAAPRVHTTHPRGRRSADSQQSLDFSGDSSHDLGTQVEAVIYCDAPVALPMHRLIAAGIDAGLIAISLGLFLGVFYLSGGSIVFNKHTLPLFVGVIGVIGFFYRMLWCLGDGDTPGMRFAGLRLVNFDGRSPGREQRGLRQLAYLLSLLSIGLGLVWALVDEESLTWHDHISKTFPTPG